MDGGVIVLLSINGSIFYVKERKKQFIVPTWFYYYFGKI